jgi:type IV pilus assembly protein PilE
MPRRLCALDRSLGLRLGVHVRRHEAGFTLIELMIVVVVVAILAAVAIPSYREYILRSNRASAQSFISDVASRQSQYLLDARSYALSLSALGMTAPADVGSRYSISITASGGGGSPPTFTVVASPIGGQVGDRCGDISINQQGVKTSSGTGTQCW